MIASSSPRKGLDRIRVRLEALLYSPCICSSEQSEAIIRYESSRIERLLRALPPETAREEAPHLYELLRGVGSKYGAAACVIARLEQRERHAR